MRSTKKRSERFPDCPSHWWYKAQSSTQQWIKDYGYDPRAIYNMGRYIYRRRFMDAEAQGIKYEEGADLD
jgi:hypothetical protein